MEADHSALGSVGQTAKNGNESDSNLTGRSLYSMEQTGVRWIRDWETVL